MNVYIVKCSVDICVRVCVGWMCDVMWLWCRMAWHTVARIAIARSEPNLLLLRSIVHGDLHREHARTRAAGLFFRIY